MTIPFGMRPCRTAEEARLLDHLVLAGWAGDFRSAPVAARDAASDALERWVRQGLPFSRLPGGARAFDPAEVINFAKCAGIAGRDDFWRTRYVATGRSLVREFGAPARRLEPRHVRVDLERRFNLAQHAPGSRVRLRVPYPAETPAVTEIRAVLGENVRAQPGYAETVVAVPPERSCTVQATYEFLALPSPAHGATQWDDGDTALYAQPPDDARISALAAELAGEARSDADAVRSFWRFFFERLKLGVLHGESSLDAILDLGWFDCRAGSALLVALCRARGIPARSCSGFTLYSVPFYHYWAEAWLGGSGWFPLDLTCWDLSLRGADEDWRDCFFGALDYRLTIEVLPRTFTGFPSVRFPSTWYALARPLERGAAFGIYAAETGELVYEDRVAVSVNAGPLLP